MDESTGEVNDKKGVFIEEQELLRRREHFRKEQEKQERELIKIKKENKELKTRNGIEAIDKSKFTSDFLWAYFYEQQMLFPDLKPQDISKLIYLSTYSNYDNFLILNNRPMKQEELRKVMNLNRSVFNPWISKMIEYKYIKYKDDKIYISKNYFGKGKLDKKEGVRAIRLFINVVQDLYLNLDAEDHNKMGLVLRLIPYINPYFNCLSLNPHETDKEKLEPLKLGRLAKMLGYSEQHCRRLGNEILAIRFGADKKRIAIAVALDNLSVKDHILMFNAKLFFGGDTTQYRLLNDIFEKYQPSEIFDVDI